MFVTASAGDENNYYRTQIIQDFLHQPQKIFVRTNVYAGWRDWQAFATESYVDAAILKKTGYSDPKGYINAYKVGRIVNIHLQRYNVSASGASWVNIGTLPEEYRTTGQIDGVLYDNNVSNWSESNVIPCRVKENGDVMAYLFPGHLTNVQLAGTIVFFV